MGEKYFQEVQEIKTKGDEIDYFKIRFLSGPMDGSEGMALATKTDDLNLVPGTQMVGENTDSNELSLACTGMANAVHIHVHTNT